VDDGFDVDLLRRDERKALRKIETHLVTENALGPGAGPVGFGGAILPDVAKKIEILFQAVNPRKNNRCTPWRRRCRRNRGTDSLI